MHANTEFGKVKDVLPDRGVIPLGSYETTQWSGGLLLIAVRDRMLGSLIFKEETLRHVFTTPTTLAGSETGGMDHLLH